MFSFSWLFSARQNGVEAAASAPPAEPPAPPQETYTPTLPRKLGAYLCEVQKASDAHSSVERLLKPLQVRLGAEREQASFSEQCWLDDIVVNGFLGYITKKYSHVINQNPHKKIISLDSIFYSLNVIPTRINEIKTHIQKTAVVPTEKSPRKTEKQYELLTTADIIVWPVYYETLRHWMLVVIEKKTKNNQAYFKLSSIDGLNLNNQRNELLAHAEDFINAFHLGEKIVKSRKINIPDQKNNYDCGPAICWAVQKILEGKKITKLKDQKVNYTKFRWEMAKQMATPLPHSPTVKRSNDHFFEEVEGPLFKKFKTLITTPRPDEEKDKNVSSSPLLLRRPPKEAGRVKKRRPSSLEVMFVEEIVVIDIDITPTEEEKPPPKARQKKTGHYLKKPQAKTKSPRRRLR